MDKYHEDALKKVENQNIRLPTQDVGDFSFLQ